MIANGSDCQIPHVTFTCKLKHCSTTFELSTLNIKNVTEKWLNSVCGCVHELTFRLFLFCVNALGNQDFIVSIIRHLQHKAPIYHTVTGFEPTVDDVTVVQVLNSLMRDCGKRLGKKKKHDKMGN